ncbi:helix-turn-helix transcriptional regulator [Pseudomonas sp. D(2018)]|uniref:helix-turn-helix transcriptional regulator n=1 Tax=Pseudomonas sp. D(2018) TaxID=2502238 RepID=UPI002115B70A|nr:helix-turn-helix transcriptional regulator [Pseudomonas sp. D(2018)]
MQDGAEILDAGSDVMPLVDEQQLYDELVALCYECVLDESKWGELLERLLQASGRQQGALMLESGRGEQVNISEISRYDPALVAPYNRYYCFLDPGVYYMPQRAVGLWHHDFQHCDVEALHRSVYHQEFQRDYGLGNLSCLKLQENIEARMYLSLMTNADARLPEEWQQRLLERLAIHLTTASRLFERIRHLQVDIAKRDLVLDSQPTPLWVLEAEGRVHYSNQAATKRMNQHDFPLFERNAFLHSRCEDARLHHLIRRAVGRDGRRSAGWLRIESGAVLELLVTPLPEDTPLALTPGKSLVLLVLLDQQPQMGLLTDLFQFSPAEQKLALLLAQQLTPEACAERLGISINTVRSQLRSLFRKTGTSRQTELLGLIGRLRF